MPNTHPALRWGILGTGGIAHTFAKDLLATGHEVSAIASRTRERATAAAAELGIPASFASYRDLVASDDVDVVYIATPHSRHAEDALLALDHGKPVLVEKAFTQNAAQAERIVSAARDAGLFAMEAMWTRFLPHMTELRRLVRSGGLGEVRTVQADHNQVLSTDPRSRLRNPDLAGGALLDLGIYPISFAADLLGLPTEVHATGDLTDLGVDRQVSVVCRHPHGATSLSQCALDQPGPNTATVIGSEGYVVIDAVWYQQTRFARYDASHRLVETFERRVPSRGMQLEATEAERCIRDGLLESPLVPLDESIAIMRVLDAIRAQIGVRYPGER